MLFKKDELPIIIRILSYLKPYKKKIGAILICIIASASINMVLPLLSKKIMDDGLMVKNFHIVVLYTLITLVIVFTDQNIGVIETKYYAYINTIFRFILSKVAYKHIMRLKIQYFNNTNFAEIMSNVGMDIGNMSRICDRSMFIIITEIFRMIGGMTGLILIDWHLAIVVVTILPIRYAVVKYLAKKRLGLFQKFMDYNKEYSAWYGDTLGGVKEIKLLGIDRMKLGQFIKFQRNIVKSNIKLSYMDKANEYSEIILTQLILSSLYILGAYMVFFQSLTIGSLFAFITFSAYVTGPISAILNIGYNFTNVIPSAKRFFEFLDMSCEGDSDTGNMLRMDTESINGNITFENVSFAYKEGVPVLNNISFQIHEGEKVALIGSNGCGKSTLNNLLLRFYKPDSGRILLDGIDINKIKLRDYRQLISVVSQDFYLFNISIEDNIAISQGRRKSNVSKAAKDSMAQDFVESMPEKFKSVVGRNGSRLSGGQRQKIAMARAFARDSKILVLDEATSNYDVESEAYIHELLKNNLKDRTVIVISHKQDILKLVDKIIILGDGSVLETGKHDDLYMNSIIYKKIIDMESRRNRKEVV